MRLEDYMQDINTRSLDSMHKFVHAMILHIGELFNFRYYINILKVSFSIIINYKF